MEPTNSNGAVAVRNQNQNGQPAETNNDVFKQPTKRQLQVVELIADGNSFNEAAAKLNLSRKTVEKHVDVAKDRLGAKTLAHAVKLAIQRGLMAV